MPSRLLGVLAAALLLVSSAVAIQRGAWAPAAGADDAVPTSTAPRPTTTLAPTTTTAAPTTTTSTVPPTTTTPPAAPAPAPAARVGPFRGLGAWVDVFDFSPNYMNAGETTPVVTPADVDRLAAEGVRTLYLQVARDDERTPGIIESPDVVRAFLGRAHAVGMQVVAWYLPKKYDDADVERFRAIAAIRVEDRGFDGIGVDIEWRADVPDTTERNRRLVDLSAKLRAALPDLPLAAIVFPPVATDIINQALWPSFPWRELAPSYDAWMPMAYWTNRSAGSEWRDAHRYVSANVAMVREHLGDPAAPVHPIGGIGDAATLGDYEGFVRAATEQGVVGLSVYDYRTTVPDAWPVLRGAPQ
jgi:hypothetical protein